jgi:hypothetical protein
MSFNLREVEVNSNLEPLFHDNGLVLKIAITAQLMTVDQGHGASIEHLVCYWHMHNL